MGAIRGKDFMLFIDTTDPQTGAVVSVPVCYSQDVKLNLEAEMLEATAPPDGGFRNFFPGLINYTLEFNGIAVENDSTTVTIIDLQNYIINKTRLSWKAFNQANQLYIYSGFMYLRSVGEASPYDSLNTFDCSAQGDGVLTISAFIPGTVGTIYYGVQDNNDIPTDFSKSIQGDAAKDIIIPYGQITGGKYYWMAYPRTVRAKDSYQDNNDTNNAGAIGAATDLFSLQSMNIGSDPYYLSMSHYVTSFAGSFQSVKFYNNSNVPNSCALAQNVILSLGVDAGQNFQRFLSIKFIDVQAPSLQYFIRLVNVTDQTSTVETRTAAQATIDGNNVQLLALVTRQKQYSVEIAIGCSLTSVSGYTQPIFFNT